MPISKADDYRAFLNAKAIRDYQLTNMHQRFHYYQQQGIGKALMDQ